MADFQKYISTTTVTSVTATNTTSPDLNYTTASLFDGEVDVVYKVAATSANIVLTNSGTVNFVAILNTNIGSGATVAFKGNATNSWGAPALSTTISTANLRVSHKNTYKEGTFGSYAYYRIEISGATSPIMIGEIILGSISTFSGTFEDFQTRVVDNNIYVGTDRSIWVYDRPPHVEFDLNFPTLEESEWQELIDLYYSQSFGKTSILLIPDNAKNYSYYGRFRRFDDSHRHGIKYAARFSFMTNLDGGALIV